MSAILGPAANRRENRQSVSERAAGLPRSYDVHWSSQRKADVVRAVRTGSISFDEAQSRYLLSRSEFETWQVELEDA